MARYPGARSFTFAEPAELNARLLALVRSGRKRATCMPVADLAMGEAEPLVGQRDIALEANGDAALVIETLAVVRVRFDEVTEEMALREGENADLAGWRADHQWYFERRGTFSPTMELIFEDFRVVEDFAAKGG
ncbi:ASCH domain-containing protein [Pararhodobacter sp. SW119]|uniref:ASCH domain-containing protein n=1 Tax=Pararhodobacter sp. SW119 TaxID=2780075 RepID=UPI001ADF70D3|nr:ASCH domain-containing protein [Pararhodobacter sp. SW119]